MRIVIVGGGFAGINFAKQLAGKQGVEIILIDRNNYHFFPPLLYQVATSFIEPSNISYPFRKMFQNKGNIYFHYGSLVQINSTAKNIETTSGKFDYDILVLAMGTETNFFGMANVEKNALPMKNIDDALHIRNHLLIQLEKATRIHDSSERQKLLTVVIAGGGPTGVEVSGMLAEMSKKIVYKDYPEFKDHQLDIYLIDAADKLLGSMSQKSQKEALATLSKLGVNIKLGISVKDYDNGKVVLSDGTTIETATLIWASGVMGRKAPGLPTESIGRGRRVMVDGYNKVIGVEGIYALGDLCYQTADTNYPNGHPQLAQVAIQQGLLLASNILKTQVGKPMKSFSYKDKGSMAIIAKFKAVVDLPKGFFKGFLAWLTWLFIHIIPLVGFGNKAKVLYNWFWSFFTNDPTLRLIIRPEEDDK
ncbi:MAG: NAD(P)/FAD-dependent oxidoreductase [Chitinophagaceae bacterium]|nr:NAD(P)/FAD-dependent oxidoreductase [Chitinophagaceae bacterium]